jgi:hypothetical protein
LRPGSSKGTEEQADGFTVVTHWQSFACQWKSRIISFSVFSLWIGGRDSYSEMDFVTKGLNPCFDIDPDAAVRSCVSAMGEATIVVFLVLVAAHRGGSPYRFGASGGG